MYLSSQLGKRLHRSATWLLLIFFLLGGGGGVAALLKKSFDYDSTILTNIF